jgi:hypothetical protein
MTAVLSQVAIGVICLLIGALGTQLVQSRKRLRFAASDWKFEYFHMDSTGGFAWMDKPPLDTKESAWTNKYSFSIRIFNEKAESTGLHRFSVQFTKGPRWAETILIQDDNPRRVPNSPSVSRTTSALESLGEMQLPSREWAAEKVVGYFDWKSILSETQTVWFVAHVPSGKGIRWEVARISRPLGARGG